MGMFHFDNQRLQACKMPLLIPSMGAGSSAPTGWGNNYGQNFGG